MKIDVELGEVTNPNPSQPNDFRVPVFVDFTNVPKPGSYEKVVNLVNEVKQDLADGKISPTEAFRILLRILDVVN